MADVSSRTAAADAANATAAWPLLELDRSRRGGLVDQIVTAIAGLVNRRQLRIGTRMPSVRQLAKCNGVSTFTVVEAYDRLVMLGLLSSRPGSGYFVARHGSAAMHPASPQSAAPAILDAFSPELYSGQSVALPVGSGWLPPEWYGDATILDAVRHAMRMPASRLKGYGHPLGFPNLRQHLAHTLSDDLVPVHAEQVMLTHGATHAFDLILRSLTRPGDTVFLEDPSYRNLLALIRHHGCVPIGIPRDNDGLDIDALAREAALHRPKLMFVTTVLHNPLGTSLNHAQAHRLLGMAESHDFRIVEDDMYRELAPHGEPSLAAMDGLRRVIRVGSFSKTLSPALRVGSIAASCPLISELGSVKMLTGLTTSEINERAVYHAISGSAYRRMLDRLRSQLESARERAIANLGDLGMKPIAMPRGGIFVSAGWSGDMPADVNGKAIADLALQAGILLAPDDFFTSAPSRSSGGPWFRFNVAYADSPVLSEFLRGVHTRLSPAKGSSCGRSDSMHHAG
jgi:DNA-binding transcriptional MocR family regulator